MKGKHAMKRSDAHVWLECYYARRVLKRTADRLETMDGRYSYRAHRARLAENVIRPTRMTAVFGMDNDALIVQIDVPYRTQEGRWRIDFTCGTMDYGTIESWCSTGVGDDKPADCLHFVLDMLAACWATGSGWWAERVTLENQTERAIARRWGDEIEEYVMTTRGDDDADN